MFYFANNSINFCSQSCTESILKSLFSFPVTDSFASLRCHIKYRHGIGLKIRFTFSLLPNTFPLLKLFSNSDFVRRCVRLSARIHTEHCKPEVLMHAGPLKHLHVTVMMWSTSSEGGIWRLSLELQWIHVNIDEKQLSSLQFISCYLSVSIHKSPGYWSMLLLEKSVHNFWCCISVPLCSTRAPLWERLGLDFSLVFRLLTCPSVCNRACSAEPSLHPIHVWLVADQRAVTTFDAVDHC